MLEKLQGYVIPETLSEAVSLLRRAPRGKTAAITGSIDLHWMRLQNAQLFIDTSRLGMDQIRDLSTSLKIGAGTPLEEIVRSKACAKFAGGLLTRGAESMVSVPRRCQTTLAALLINAVPWCDLVPALCALNAKVVVQGQKKRTLALTDLFAGKGRADLDRELIVEVVIPKPKGKLGTAIERTGLVVSDEPILSAVATVAKERGKIKAATIAIGGGLTVAVRLPDIEKALKGEKPSEALFREAGENASQIIDPISDVRASADHRRAVCPALVRRALMAAAGLEENK